MKQAIRSLGPTHDAGATITSDRGTILRALEQLQSPGERIGLLDFMAQVIELPVQDIVWMALDIDIQSEQKVGIDFHCGCRDAERSGAIADRMNVLLTAIESSERVVRSALVIEHRTEARDGTIHIRVDVNRVWDAIERWQRGRAD
jgi:hypothetical protein